MIANILVVKSSCVHPNIPAFENQPDGQNAYILLQLVSLSDLFAWLRFFFLFKSYF